MPKLFLSPRLLLPAQPQLAYDTDCACAERPFDVRFENAPVASGPHAQIAGAFTCNLPRGFSAVMSPYAPHGPSVVNAAGRERWQQFAQPQPLTDAFDAQLASELLIQPAGAPPQPAEPPADTLTVWLHVTNACNLDCPYCYVRKSSQSMSAEAGEAAIRTACRTAVEAGMTALKLKYAGGEATLHFVLVRALHAYAVKQARAHGLALREVLLTNGTLLRPADAAWCQAEGMKIMVSLDGVGALHDQLRPWRKGSGSFAQVQRTVDEVLLLMGLRPDVSMTVSGANAHGAADVARWALVERGLPLSFNFYRATPLTACRSELALEEEQLIEGLLAAYQVIEDHLPTTPFLDGLIDRGHLHAHSHTCGVGRSYLVIDHTGKVNQCQMHLQAGRPFAAGEDVLSLVAAGPIRNLPVDQKEGCRACSFRYRCAGGCPLETLRSTGRWDVQSPNCNIYRALWPAALRLEGLRLLKVHGYLH